MQLVKSIPLTFLRSVIGVHLASLVQLRSYLEEIAAASV
jgi:hypothetical protein